MSRYQKTRLLHGWDASITLDVRFCRAVERLLCGFRTQSGISAVARRQEGDAVSWCREMPDGRGARRWSPRN